MQIRKFTLIGIAAVSLALLAVLTTDTRGHSNLLAPEDTISLAPTADIIVHQALGPADDRAALIGRDLDGPNAYTLLKFDLATATAGWAAGTILKEARLHIGVAGSCQNGSIAPVSLWGMPASFDGSWDETSLPGYAGTATALQAAQPLMASPAGGIVNGTVGHNGYVDWIDTGTDAFASWLETQRQTTSGTATVVLVMEAPPAPGRDVPGQIMFEDREETLRTVAQCLASPGPPILEITNRSPLAVTVASFEVACAGATPELVWETVNEIDNQGFNLWRGVQSAEPKVRLNATLIPSQSPGGSQGSIYRWTDSTAAPNTPYYYWLESVAFNGATQRYGPAGASCGAPRLAPRRQ